MNSALHIKLQFNATKDAFLVETDVKQERLKDVLGEVVRVLIGAGEDHSDTEIKDIYTVDITIDLSEDEIWISSDCGNKGLESGIIAEAFVRMNKDGVIA